ncbi:MAG: 3-oxocholest-4-en-26-oyl-CoA dehydrogenase beta subunit [Actinomycetota bacterium]|jgi:alkylation response protein AidB-like acyl-CoA dehydrogenase|nr:3-oxocholest-4-en-26-oyl-CoA dehydrogenase beta subunit [Actinomycetota bacterium]
MDFTTTEDQQALVGLATQILGELATPKRLAELEKSGTWYDDSLWRQLAEAGIVGAALSEDVGGGGMGFTELALLLEQVGAHVAPVPLFETVLCAALPIDVFGTPEQRTRDLPDVAAGQALLTAALVESGRDDPRRPLTTATPDDLQRQNVGAASQRAGSDATGGWRVSGLKSCVPFAEQARRILVPATTPDGDVVLALIEPTAAGVTLRPQVATNGQPQAELELADVAVAGADVLPGGAETLGWILDRALTGLAATALGVSGRALAMSAQYTSSREQFGRVVATFQAVGHRLADAYVDVEAMRLTTLQAVWLLDSGLPGSTEAAVAKWWACEGGHRVAHAAQHVHGGVGVDVEYPLFRYFRWSKQLEMTLGAATAQLLRLGATLAAEPA